MISTHYRELWQETGLANRISEGINANRQSDHSIRVTDYAGAPVAGVTIAVKQFDSPFYFGANIFQLGSYDSDTKNRAYEAAYVALFSGATVPFYWRTLEPERGSLRFAASSIPISRRPPPDTVLEFCEQHGLRTHGHTLLWGYRQWSAPDWLPLDLNESELLARQRIRLIAERYGSRVSRWDVVNEAVAVARNPERCHPLAVDYERKGFEWAAAYFPPGLRFDLNETTAAWDPNDQALDAVLERLISSGAPVGGIGLQFHLFADGDVLDVGRGLRFPPSELLAVLDRYASFGLPIHISEITLGAADNNSVEGLALQAQIATDLYRLWFSHPAVEGISWWNLPDGGAAVGEGGIQSGLLYDNLRPKPAYNALQKLIREEWRTSFTATTDADGRVSFRGFHGQYQLVVDGGTRGTAGGRLDLAFTLDAGSNKEVLIHL